MKKEVLKRIGIISVITLVCLYAIFLILPFILTPVLQGYIPQIKKEVKKATNLDLTIEGLRLVSTPKLTVGVKVKNVAVNTPNTNKVLYAENFQVKMSVLPLLMRKIRVDLIKTDNLDVNLRLNKDGSFELEKYLIKEDTNEQETEKSAEIFELPFGFKLSNHLPNIKINKYNIIFTDITNNQKYIISGNKAEVTDFIFNKHVRLNLDGKITLKDREQFVYNIKLNNKIMPEMTLNDFVFKTEQQDEKQTKEDVKINILEVLNGLYNNQITLNVNTDLKTEKDKDNLYFHGYSNFDNLSIAPNNLKLPASKIDLQFKGHKISIDSDLYTANNEISKLYGTITTGKNIKTDIEFKSKADLASLVKIINAVAITFNIKDLQTLTANGKIDADFNIKSDLKNVKSNGYFKIPSANLYYGLYKVGLDNIKTNITLNNNNVNIENVSFSILNQPLKLYGTIKADSTADLHLISQNLNLKGLLIALGQAALMKENNINSGTVSITADAIGKLTSIKPSAKILLNNINIKNIPTNITLKLPETVVDINSDGKTFTGKAIAKDIKAINPALTVSVPKIEANITENEINISKTPITADKINITLEGYIKNYLKEKMMIGFVTQGDITSNLDGDVNMAKQSLNLNFSAPNNNQIVIPMFNKSKMTFNGNTTISGKLTNPLLNGSFNVKQVSIPEIPVTLDNMIVKLNGAILNGNATIGKFTSGGIVAENLSSNFAMKGTNFYLTNLQGKAYKGNIAGNIIYNMSNAKTDIVFNGNGLDAAETVSSVIGVKNAISGALSFDTKLSMTVKEYNEMIKSMKGNFNFKINNGSFGSVCRLENMLSAANVVANSVLKTTVSTLSTLSGIKDTAKFDYVQGSLNFANGWANINPIKSTGSKLAYYITGKYNILNGTTNIVILGRLDSTVVALLGPLGDLSTSKLLSYIPKFGTTTANVVQALTSNPKAENTAALPKLSNNSKSYKDFKVVFNGGLESQSSVKSFKWLTNADTSAIQPVNIVDTVKSLKTTTKTDVSNTVNNFKDSINTVKTQQEAIKNSAQELKNLFKF